MFMCRLMSKLTHSQWAWLEPLLPQGIKPGRPRGYEPP